MKTETGYVLIIWYDPDVGSELYLVNLTQEEFEELKEADDRLINAEEVNRGMLCISYAICKLEANGEIPLCQKKLMEEDGIPLSWYARFADNKLSRLEDISSYSIAAIIRTGMW